MSDLVTFVRSLIAAGDANGWQSFGQGSTWDATELGQDIGLAAGTAVPGIVTAVVSWGYGDSAVTERLANGDLLTVGHLTPAVQVGQAVQAGDTLGTSRGLPSPISSGQHSESGAGVGDQPHGSAQGLPRGESADLPGEQCRGAGVGTGGREQQPDVRILLVDGRLRASAGRTEGIASAMSPHHSAENGDVG